MAIVKYEVYDKEDEVFFVNKRIEKGKIINSFIDTNLKQISYRVKSDNGAEIVLSDCEVFGSLKLIEDEVKNQLKNLSKL